MPTIVSTLSDFIQVNGSPLWTKGLQQSRTIEILSRFGSVVSGIKNEVHMFSIETTDLVIQAAGCGAGTNPASGDTTVLKIPVNINPLMFRQTICQRTLEQKFNGAQFASGQRMDDSSLGRFAIEYTGEKLQAAGHEIDRILWRGDEDNGTGNLKRANGFLKIMKGLSASTQNIASSALTEANCNAVLKRYFDVLPNEAKSKNTITMFMGYDELEIAKGVNADFYKYSTPSDPFLDTIPFPYRRMRIEAVHGLDGTGRKIVVADPRLMLIGTDNPNDLSNGGVSLFYDRTDRTHYFDMEWAQGCGIGFGSYFVNDLL